jgi:ribonuclease-3
VKPRRSWWSWLTGLFVRPGQSVGAPPARRGGESFDQQEARAIAEFSRHFRITFHDPELLRLALTHRSYLSVTGMGPRESNERMEFLGDSVLGLVTSEYLYRLFPDEHEGQLTKTKSLLVSKAILSRKALSMGLGRFVLLSHSEVESGGRQRLSILADAFESVVAAIYLDQGFEEAREFIEYWLLRGSREIVADKRHRNYKSHLQEYVQSTFRTHPVYRIRSQMGPDHSKLFLVEVMVGRRALGEGRGPNKKEAEQAAARDALENVERPGQSRGEEREPREVREEREPRREAREEREPRRDAREEREPRREAREEREPRREAREEREPRRDAREEREPRREAREAPVVPPVPAREPAETDRDGFRSRRSGRGRRGPGKEEVAKGEPVFPKPVRAREPVVERPGRPAEVEPPLSVYEEDSIEEIGRPEGPLDERHIDPFGIGAAGEPAVAGASPEFVDEPWTEADPAPAWEPSDAHQDEFETDRFEDEPVADRQGDEAAEDEAPGPGVLPPEGGPPTDQRYGRRRARRR